jgi:hypothetical protein
LNLAAARHYSPVTVHSIQAPEIGESFRGVPTRHGTKNTLQKTLRVLDITDDKMNMPRSAAERTTILFDGLITDLIRKVEEGGQGGPIVDV